MTATPKQAFHVYVFAANAHGKQSFTARSAANNYFMEAQTIDPVKIALIYEGDNLVDWYINRRGGQRQEIIPPPKPEPKSVKEKYGDDADDIPF